MPFNANYLCSQMGAEGKIMAYAALGHVRDKWLPFLKDLYALGEFDGHSMMLACNLFKNTSIQGVRDPQIYTTRCPRGYLSLADARDLAATSQQAFEEAVLGQLHTAKAQLGTDLCTHVHRRVHGHVRRIDLVPG